MTRSQRQTVYVGIETNMLALKRDWRITGVFPQQEGSLLVGSETARSRGWQIGQHVHCRGCTGQTGTVAGILAPTGGADDTFIYLRLADAQRIFHHPNELTHILVRLGDPNALDHVVAELRGCDAGLAMNVVPLAHVFHTIQSVVNSTRVLFGCVALVALLLAGTGVSNTILMAVAERRAGDRRHARPGGFAGEHLPVDLAGNGPGVRQGAVAASPSRFWRRAAWKRGCVEAAIWANRCADPVGMAARCRMCGVRAGLGTWPGFCRPGTRRRFCP